MKAGRAFMSIGEVLTALKGEHPEITVSKIRFLESEGLIAPERTASGYRKFYQKDLDRLRFVLTLQRDSYLPLKVIRERLAMWERGESGEQGDSGERTAAAEGVGPATPLQVLEAEDDLADPAPGHLTESDLASAAGLELGQVRALREFGVICDHALNGSVYFDQDDLIVGKIARDFLKYGIEPRHLKMFRHFAEREAALFEQVVLPAMRNRSPESRRQATGALSELAGLSKKLRHSFLRQKLRTYVAGNG